MFLLIISAMRYLDAWVTLSKDRLIKLVVFIPIYVAVALSFASDIVIFFVEGKTWLGIFSVIGLILVLVTILFEILFGVKKLFRKMSDYLTSGFTHFTEREFGRYFTGGDEAEDIGYSIAEMLHKFDHVYFKVHVNEQEIQRILPHVGRELQRLRPHHRSIVMEVYTNGELLLICGFITNDDVVAQITHLPFMCRFLLVSSVDDGMYPHYFIYEAKPGD